MKITRVNIGTRAIGCRPLAIKKTFYNLPEWGFVHWWCWSVYKGRTTCFPLEPCRTRGDILKTLQPLRKRDKETHLKHVSSFIHLSINHSITWVKPFMSSVWLSKRSRDRTIHRTSMLESTRELLIWVRNIWNWGGETQIWDLLNHFSVCATRKIKKDLTLTPPSPQCWHIC